METDLTKTWNYKQVAFLPYATPPPLQKNKKQKKTDCPMLLKDESLMCVICEFTLYSTYQTTNNLMYYYKVNID